MKKLKRSKYEVYLESQKHVKDFAKREEAQKMIDRLPKYIKEMATIKEKEVSK